MSGPLHLHLGIHKTASTFLQRRFFPALGGVRYVSARGPLRPWLHAILRDDDLDFDPGASRRALDAAFDTEPGHAAPRVVSDEQLYGSPYDGGATRTRTLDRLAQVAPDAHVHVVFRRQPDQLRSLYLQYVKTGGGASVEEFLTHRGWPLHVTPGYFRYAEYVEALQARFTASRVHVYLFEDLRADAEGWLRAWCGALGVPEDGWPRDILAARDNPGIAPRVVPWLRAANRVARSGKQPFQAMPLVAHRAARWLAEAASARLRDKGQVIDDARALAFLTHMHSSNQRLGALTGCDVAALGYPTES